MGSSLDRKWNGFRKGSIWSKRRGNRRRTM